MFKPDLTPDLTPHPTPEVTPEQKRNALTSLARKLFPFSHKVKGWQNGETFSSHSRYNKENLLTYFGQQSHTHFGTDGLAIGPNTLRKVTCARANFSTRYSRVRMRHGARRSPHFLTRMDAGRIGKMQLRVGCAVEVYLPVTLCLPFSPYLCGHKFPSCVKTVNFSNYL